MSDVPANGVRPVDRSPKAKAEMRRWVERWKLLEPILDHERCAPAREGPDASGEGDGLASAVETLGAAGGLMDLASRFRANSDEQDPVLQREKQLARDAWARLYQRYRHCRP